MNEKEFITAWVSKLSGDNFKNFPADFLTSNSVYEFELPAKSILIGNEFFGAYEIITIDGQSVLQADSYSKAKYFVYSNRNKDRKILIPNDNKELNECVTAYEEYLDEIIKRIDKSFKMEFPESKTEDAAINDIFRSLNINRY